MGSPCEKNGIDLVEADKKEKKNGTIFHSADDTHPEAEVFIETESARDLVLYPHGRCSRGVEVVEVWLNQLWNQHKKKATLAFKITLFALYLTYFGYCVHYRYHDEGSYILTAITGAVVIKIVAGLIDGPRLARALKKCQTCIGTSNKSRRVRAVLRYGLYIVASVLLCVYFAIDVIGHSVHNGQAVLGIFCLLLVCFIFSYKPSKVNWHPVFWGFFIQFAFATLTLRTVIGYEAFKWMGDIVHAFVRLSDMGSAFVFGDSFRATKAGFFFETAGVIVFFNSCIFIMDYFGVLEFIVLKIGRGLSLCLETGPVESVVSAANIFIGLSEAPLLIRPYLPTVTKSELHAIMTCGFASISGAFMAMFIKSGAPASHLLTAAVISAPAALAISKLMYPEMERVDLESQSNIKMRDEESTQNLLQAASDGAAFSTKLVAAIMVNMIAFVSILNLLNKIFVWIGERAGVSDLTFDIICSYLMFPLTYVMGATPEDCGKIGALIGIKFFATPFVAYAELGKMIQNRRVFEEYTREMNGTWYLSGEDVILEGTNTTLVKGFMTERSEVITTYALCGISAFPAIGFCMGTLIPMCPSRKKDVIALVLRAFVAGNLANFVTGAVAGVMYTG
ncbi:solute carrier family 28 member 3-like [Physella acuta]|uniref:solute carrier family 28 member 3-like n=1 Tax=Physella acuta TaxID=109671 RepID=UPI0027DD77BD|nr:solute carrier family 28 member 3-like [Physella acuta]XP_059151402.1 solute carrier family 28 member 3-like [Physella acuta]